MSRAWRIIFVLSYLAVMLVKARHHEIWQDEAEYWDAARASGSLAELRQNTLYMGQPPLGHLVLYGLSRLTRDPFAMQALNAVVITGAVAVVSFAAPWSPLQQALFAFGYFPFFEYGTVSRHYALMLGLALALAAVHSRAARLTPGATALAALLALANFHGTLLALAFLIALLVRATADGRPAARSEIAGLVVLAVAVVAAAALARPPADSVFLKAWVRPLEFDRLEAAALQLGRACAPFPVSAPPWWNRFWLDQFPLLEIGLGLAGGALVAFAVRRDRLALVFLLGATCGVSAFSYLQWGTSARHAGVLFTAALVALWLASVSGRVLTLLLVLQVPGALLLSYRDLVGAFSPSAATARYLREQGLASLPLVGFREFTVAPVFTLLDRPFFSPASRRWRTRPVYSSEMKPAARNEIGAIARRLATQSERDVVLVLDKPAPRGARLLACFADEFYGREFCVYRVPFVTDGAVP